MHGTMNLKNPEALGVTSKETGLEVNADSTKCTLYARMVQSIL